MNVKDKIVHIICLIAPILTFVISYYSKEKLGFDFGFFVLVLNGALTFMGLLIIKK